MYIDGVKTRFASPEDAIAKGIGMVHQHFSLVPQYDGGGECGDRETAV